MGASSSINDSLLLDVYVSYNEQNYYVDTLIQNIVLLNYKIMNSSIITSSMKDLPISEITKYVEIIMVKTKYIFICISPQTIRSITQTIEMNEMNINDLNSKLIYLMVDSNYTPDTNKEINSIIKKNKWFALYDDETLFQTNNKIITLLLNNIE